MAPTQHSRQRGSFNTEAGNQRKAKKHKKSLKYKLRGIQRLLRQKDLPATVRIAQERMLCMIQENLRESEKKRKERTVAKRYKMVKFFEKRKVSRLYTSCLNDLTTCTDEQREELNNTLELYKQQWNYITYFPKDDKYISLFPPTPCDNAETIKRQERIIKMIKDKVDNGEISDTSDAIIRYSKEKKNKEHIKSNIKPIKPSGQQEKTEEEDADVVKKDDNGGYFIDTNPSKETKQESSTTRSTSGVFAITNQSTYSTLGSASDKTTNQHKVKRLKKERDVAASTKKKKIERKSTDESD